MWAPLSAASRVPSAPITNVAVSERQHKFLNLSLVTYIRATPMDKMTGRAKHPGLRGGGVMHLFYVP